MGCQFGEAIPLGGINPWTPPAMPGRPALELEGRTVCIVAALLYQTLSRTGNTWEFPKIRGPTLGSGPYSSPDFWNFHKHVCFPGAPE